MSMKTLKEIIIDRKLRKGPSEGTTADGAYWVPKESGEKYFAKLKRCGGDGIGQSGPDITYWLELRHYRSGLVKAVIVRDAYHQNDWSTTKTDASAILDCTTIEDVIVILKQREAINETSGLLAKLSGWGMPESSPSPDEEGGDKLFGFSVANRGEESAWFHSRAAAQRFAEACGWGSDAQIEESDTERVERRAIMDTATKPWTKDGE